MLLTAFAFALASRATGTAAPTPTGNVTQKPTIATTGSGPEYASACWKALIDYDVSSSSWDSAHQWISTTTEFVGGTSFSDVTYYESATTLCDGHARVTYSPAKSLSTGTITHPGTVTSTKTILGTYFSAWSQSAPTCSIAPSDCDGLWKAYSTSLSAAGGQTTNPPLETPPCMGRSAASSYASVTNEIYGCGDCTIFGEGVELVYFPTYPSSRDMCAMTPTASLTHYGSDAVITAYAGKSFGGEGDASGKRTAVADGHTFTSGTAYISISTVYAVDRCSKTFGTPVKDAILAMPSESVLSLRYSQDHFQRLMSTDKVTGYPVSYADFNTPIPWSAWNGQNLCDPGGYGGWACSIIYEHSFRPQLAIPPQITQLSPEFEKCQMWYNGLWDPPLALTEASEEDKPTAPGEHQTKQTAAPNSAPAAPTTTRTALANELPTTSEGSDNGRPTLTAGGPTLPASRPTEPTKPAASCVPDAEPWVQSFHVGSATYWATGANRQACIESATITSGGPTQTLKDGTHASYGDDGLILQGANTVKIGDEAASAVTSGAQHTGESQPDGRHTVVVTVDGQEATAVQTSNGGPIVVGTYATLTPGGSPTTLSNGEVYSAAMGGLVVGWTSTVGKDQTSPSAPDSDDSNDAASDRIRLPSNRGWFFPDKRNAVDIRPDVQ
ncbi:hypothetical protein PRZ48_013354 [Zasmidium cellare]|uniref:Uncharacterized protein n=1 Tax=Zasmidium cellare TaxID=395010 RepID=A0ABR0E0S1_ZASCE|nr:hypothetical protein PRZ48_013354 [Zasmidium cellare]